ncbi:MAG: hypothetical protein QOJ79_2965 [Actinomycetota bacterium]|jgi:hypothetical protein|nr:hypothetical protein [Actinomycetota bacterium]
MTRIEADPGRLAATSHALQDAAAVAQEVHRGARSLSDAAAATGSGRLAEALGGFRHTWAYGLGLVVDDARTLARMLGQAATVYEQTDASIARACPP